MKHLVIKLSVLLCHVCLASVVLAQETPDNFYQGRYVEKMMQAQDQLMPTERSGSSIVSSLPDASNKSQSSIAEDARNLLNKETEGGVPIQGFSAVINADDLDHFTENLKLLTETALALDLPLYKIETSGNYLAFARSREARARAGLALFIAPLLGAVPTPGKQLQEQFKLRHSPSWILHTARGNVLLDGVSDPRHYINKNGEFIERGQISGLESSFSKDQDLKHQEQENS